MKTQYFPPESRALIIQIESFVCQSSMDEGLGTIDPVPSLDFNDDVWPVIL